MLGNKLKCAVVVAFVQFAKESEPLTIIFSRVEKNERGLIDKRVQAVKKRVAANERPAAANAGYEDEVVIVRSPGFNKILGNFLFVQGTLEGLEQLIIPFVLLEAVGSIQQLAVRQVLHHKLKEIDVGVCKIRSAFGKLIQER